MSELALKTTRGMFWSIIDNLSLQFIQFAVSVILARLLLPEEFGVIGLLTLLLALAQSLLDSGFGSALVQKKNIDQVDACSVFYFNIGVGLAVTLALCWAAPMIAQFFSEPILASLTPLLSLVILINAFGLVPLTLLTKRMYFGALLKTNLTAAIISGFIGISAALAGYGVWSLAVQAVLGALLRSVMLWRTSQWRPHLTFSFSSLTSMFPFGSRLLLSGILDTLSQNIYLPVIGKLYSAVDLGYYVRAQTMQSMAVQPAGFALVRVMFPALSSIQDDKLRMKQIFRKILVTAVLFHFPLMIGLIVIAAPLIDLLFTDRWSGSVLYFQLLCVIGLSWPLHVLNLNVLKATGRSDLFFRLEIIKKVLLFLSIIFTYRWGISALLYGQIVTSIAAYYLNSYFSGRLTSYSTAEQVHDIFPYLVLAVLMGLGMHLVGITISLALPRLIAQVLAGVTLYLVLNYIFSRSILVELTSLAKRAIHIPSVLKPSRV